MKNHVRLFGLAQIFVLFMSFSNSYAVAAPRITPRTAKTAGVVLSHTFSLLLGGAAVAVGSNQASAIENSGEPYVVSWYVQWQDGQYYRVCQNAQSGRYISEPYWCQ